MTEESNNSGRLILQLYIAGDSPNSILARANLRAALGPFPDDEGTLEIIDVLQDPERALRERVLVTPTLVKVSPPPARRAIGNLKDRNALIVLLGARIRNGE
jgi:circadian clock protein KaiB